MSKRPPTLDYEPPPEETSELTVWQVIGEFCGTILAYAIGLAICILSGFLWYWLLSD